MIKIFEKFFYPKSLALVGASNKQGKVGYSLFKKLISFNGKIFFVNAEGYSIDGVQTYKNLDEIQESIDLVIIAVPAVFVKELLLQSSKKNIKNAIVISAGFSESGNISLTSDVLKTCRDHKIRVLGPNDFGVVNSSNNLDCTFSKFSPRSGNIAFAS